jgi:tRNA(Ile)-lysidine synthetase-like protein
MDVERFRERVERAIRGHALIPPGGEVVCLVSGGADSTCLWHVLVELGYEVIALHVDHGLRDAESDEDARFCRELFGAEVVDGRGGTTEDELRQIRYSFATDRLRATGHTASDQVETVLYRIVSSGSPGGIERRRADGVVRPLLDVRREETEAYCAAVGLPFRRDSSNADTKRGFIRRELLPRLRELDPRADANLLRLLERAPVALEGEVRWGAWRIRSEEAGLKVRGWRAGDRLAGRRRKVQDVFVDARVPRSEREAWPLVVRGDEVVAVPGLAEAPGYEGRVEAVRVES